MIRITCTILAALSIISLQAEDWPKFQGPAGKGISTETGLKLSDWGEAGPKSLWARTFNKGFGGAAIVGDEVFLVDRQPAEADVLYCLDLQNGTDKWTYTFENPGKLPYAGSRGVPSVTDQAVYFTSGLGQIHRVNRETHQADWVVSIMDNYGAKAPKWGWAQSPIISGNTIIAAVLSEDVGLIGLNKDTGEEMWRTEGLGTSHSTPVLLNLHGVEQVVFGASDGSSNGTTISVAIDSGKVLWKTDIYYNKHPIPFPTKVAEDLVFLTGGYDCGSCMIRVSDRWEVSKEFDIPQGSQIHPPFLIGDHLYLLINENANHKGEKRVKGGLACMDLKGNIIWSTKGKPYMGRGNMIYADGKLLIQDGEVGYLRVIDPSPDGYEELSVADIFGKKEKVDAQIAKQAGRKRIKIPDFQFWSPMALGSGHLVMRGQEQVVCLKLK